MIDSLVYAAKTVVYGTILGVVLFLLSTQIGCALFNPGGQVRQGLSQSQLYEWKADGNFWVEGKGPQEQEFTMAQGVVVINQDGTINQDESQIEYYLHSKPSADDAAGALAAAFKASTEQMKSTNELITNLVSQILPVIRPKERNNATIPTEPIAEPESEPE